MFVRCSSHGGCHLPTASKHWLPVWQASYRRRTSPSPKTVISLKPSHSTKEVLFISRGWFEMSGPVSQRIHATANIFSHHFPIFKFKTQSISPIRKKIYIYTLYVELRYSRYMKQYKMVLTIRELYSAKTFFIRRSVYLISDVNMQPGFYI